MESSNSIAANALGNTLALARIRIYQANGTQWMQLHEGIVGLLSNCMKLVNANTGQIVWEQRLYRGLEYSKKSPSFYEFEGDLAILAFVFVSPDEASLFEKAISNLDLDESGKSSNRISGIIGAVKPKADRPAKKAIDKSKISGPSGFQHVGGVKLNDDGKFVGNNLKPEWREAIKQAGITDEMLHDEHTRKKIIRTLKGAERSAKTLPVEPTLPGAFPSTPSRAPPVPNGPGRAPPPPPPKKAGSADIPSTNRRPPPPPPRRGEAAGNVSPAPALRKSNPPPPPPSRRKASNATTPAPTTFVPIAQASVNQPIPAAPPVLPVRRVPPPPSKGSSVPPPPTASRSLSSNVPPPPLAGPPPPPPPMVPPSMVPPPPPPMAPQSTAQATQKLNLPAEPEGRMALLDQIRSVDKSSVLKKANEATDENQTSNESNPTGLAAILADAMKQRRPNLDTSSDDDEYGDEDEDWD